MDKFGKLLRDFREACKDPRNPKRKLSQIRLGELMGIELGDHHGFSGVMVSYWESGKNKIGADDRLVLISLLKILRKHGGLKTPAQADELLEAGNYRALNDEERKSVFGYSVPEIPTSESKYQISISRFFLERIFFDSPGALQNWLETIGAGPSPAWPRILIALFRKILDRWSILNILQGLTWFWIWLLTWRLLTPSLRWPFSNQSIATLAIGLYVIGTLAIPLMIGVLTNTKNNGFWQQHNLGDAIVTRLYTYQGAGIGFHLGYFGVFAISLLQYYLHISSALWFEVVKAGFPLVFGYIGAQVIPYNLWLAYRRLNLADGGIFFLFWVFGPLWGLFLFKFYEVFLDLTAGPFIILLAITILIMLMARRKRQTNSTVIPVPWWVMIYGSVAILYQISISRNLYSVVSLTALIVALSALLGLGRIRITLPGALMGLTAIGLLIFAFQLDAWVGVLAAGFILLIWWFWGKKHLSLPWSFWIVILIDIGCGWLYQQKLLSDTWASIAFGDVTLLLLWAEHRVLNTTRLS